MKDVGIVTFYLTHNHGTMLQCYALKTVIERLGNYKVHIIPHTYFDSIGNGFGEPYLYQKYDKSIALFDSFLKNELECTEPHIPVLTKDTAPKYDIYVAGSDAIWNTELIENDNAFFLGFAEDMESVKIAYAPSLSINDTTHLNRSIFERYIDKFDFLSVREKEHAAFIKQFTNKEVDAVLDPTYLLDQEAYLELMDCERKKEKSFILIYLIYEDAFSVQKIINYANRIALRHEWDVVHFVYNIPEYVLGEKGKTFAFDGPKDFLWYFYNADLIFTNSFHGLAFSIIFRKNFWVRPRPTGKSKIVNMLEQIGLTDRIMKNQLVIDESEFAIDYSEVEQKLNRLIDHSYHFLSTALNDVQIEEREK